MTSFAFILGVVPLVLATGAGAEMRRTLGIAVFSGMLGVTIFGIFFTPVFYSVVRWFTERNASPAAGSSSPASVSGSSDSNGDIASMDGHGAHKVHPGSATS